MKKRPILRSIESIPAWKEPEEPDHRPEPLWLPLLERRYVQEYGRPVTATIRY